MHLRALASACRVFLWEFLGRSFPTRSKVKLTAVIVWGGEGRWRRGVFPQLRKFFLSDTNLVCPLSQHTKRITQQEMASLPLYALCVTYSRVHHMANESGHT
jgi:hypothetical protein